MSKCELCGEPMPEGEEMFKFHGYSGPCPKPPLKKEKDQEELHNFYREKYNELLYAVCRKFPGESRHQTALRYIREAEKDADMECKQS